MDARGLGIADRVVQVSVAGSYSSTVPQKPVGGHPPPAEPPTAYSLPFGAAASPRLLRGVFRWWAFVVQVSMARSYSSTTEQTPTGGQPTLPSPPAAAYSLPFGVAASPTSSRGMCRLAFRVQVFIA